MIRRAFFVIGRSENLRAARVSLAVTPLGDSRQRHVQLRCRFHQSLPVALVERNAVTQTLLAHFAAAVAGQANSLHPRLAAAVPRRGDQLGKPGPSNAAEKEAEAESGQRHY